MKKIYIVEDELEIANLLKKYLELENFSVEVSNDGYNIVDKIVKFSPDILIIDLMLPGMSGEEIIKKIREISDIHIIVISAKREESSVFNSFEIGADDYFRKPFSPKELVLKVKAIAKKMNSNNNINLDINTLTVYYLDKKIKLTKNEFNILSLFYMNKERVYTREQIIDILFKDYEAYDRTIDAYIKNIRKKVDPKIIETVHGLGYKYGEDYEV